MKPVSFHPNEQSLTSIDRSIRPLPAVQAYTEINRQPITISCWATSWRERLAILFGRPIYYAQLSHRQPPILLTTDKSEVGL